MARAFGATFPEVQWIVLAYLLAVTILIVGAGLLGDLAGRRQMLLLGIVVFTTASLLCGVAATLAVLVAARAVQGLGAAAMMVLTMAVVADAVPRARTGTAMGLLATMSAVGTALGPSFGGVLVAGLGWRAIFLVLVPLGLVTLGLADRTLPATGAPRRPAGPRSTTQGMALLAFTLGTVALAVTVEGGIVGTVALLLGALIGVVAFVIVEARATAPLVLLQAFRDPVRTAGFRGARAPSSRPC